MDRDDGTDTQRGSERMWRTWHRCSVMPTGSGHSKTTASACCTRRRQNPSLKRPVRMRESRTYGSVRGALSNGRPYRDPCQARPLREWAAYVSINEASY